MVEDLSVFVKLMTTSLIHRAPRLISRNPIIFSLPSACIRHIQPVSLLTRRGLSSTEPQEPPIDDFLLPRPIERSYETPEVTRARLLYQSRKRGILETDLLLSTFAHKYLPTMSKAELHEYDKVFSPSKSSSS